MPATAEIHVGDIGVQIKAHISDESGLSVDVSTASILELILRKPDGTTVTKTATRLTTGVDGWITWTSTVAGDFDIFGTWRIQGHVTLDASHSFKTLTASFPVRENL